MAGVKIACSMFSDSGEDAFYFRVFAGYGHNYLGARNRLALKGEEGRGNLGARGRKESRKACKDAIVFSIFHAQILGVKIVIGQN